MNRHAMPYRLALRWLLRNDNVEFLDDPQAPSSVTAVFIADSYGRSDSQLRADLLLERGEGI